MRHDSCVQRCSNCAQITTSIQINYLGINNQRLVNYVTQNKVEKSKCEMISSLLIQSKNYSIKVKLIIIYINMEIH